MSAPHTIPATPVPIPTQGYNAVDPLSNMDASYASWMLNIDPEARYLRARASWKIHADLSANADRTLALMAHEDELFCYSRKAGNNNKIWDVTTSTPALVHTTGAQSGAGTNVHTVYHANRSYFVTDTNYANTARYYDGTTWSSYGFTSGGSIGAPVNVSFKGHFYTFNGGSAYYGALAAVTGATTNWAIEDIFTRKGEIIWAKTLTSPTAQSSEQFLAIGNIAGEILVYAGDDPDASNWEQVARFKTSPPLFWNAALEYRNDIWVLTSTGVVSVRKLFQQGSDTNEEVSVSAKIDPWWNKLVEAIVRLNSINQLASRASVVYWPEVNKVVLMIQGAVDKTGDFNTFNASDTTYLVYNAYTGAWVPWRNNVIHPGGVQKGPLSLTYFNNALYCITDDQVMVYDGDDYLGDEKPDAAGVYDAYGWAIDGAYTNFGSANRHKDLAAVEPVIKTTTDGGNIKVSTVADFTRRTSGKTSQTFPTSYTNYTGYHYPSYRAGVRGTHLAWCMSGDAEVDDPTTMFELYAMGLVIK